MPDPTQHPLGPLDGLGRFDWERAIKRCSFGSTATRLVALTMATWADNDTGGSVRPGRDRLSASTGLHLVTVTRSITALRDLGLVFELSRGRLGKGGQAKASEYALSFPRAAANLINSFAVTTDKNGKKLLFQDKDVEGRFIPVLFPLEDALKGGMAAADRKYREAIADHYERIEDAGAQGRSDAPALGSYEAPELPRSGEANTYLASDVDLPSNEPNLGSAGVEPLVAEALPQGSSNSHSSSNNNTQSSVAVRNADAGAHEAPVDGEIVGDEYTFADFWETYPRKAAKGAALRAWEKATAKNGADPAAIVQGAQRYADDMNRDPAFTKHPATWINAQCWEDDPIPPKLSKSELELQRTASFIQGAGQNKWDDVFGAANPFTQPQIGSYSYELEQEDRTA